MCVSVFFFSVNAVAAHRELAAIHCGRSYPGCPSHYPDVDSYGFLILTISSYLPLPRLRLRSRMSSSFGFILKHILQNTCTIPLSFNLLSSRLSLLLLSCQHALQDSSLNSADIAVISFTDPFPFYRYYYITAPSIVAWWVIFLSRPLLVSLKLSDRPKSFSMCIDFEPLSAFVEDIYFVVPSLPKSFARILRCI